MESAVGIKTLRLLQFQITNCGSFDIQAEPSSPPCTYILLVMNVMAVGSGLDWNRVSSALVFDRQVCLLSLNST